MTKHKVTVEEMDRCTADPVKRLEDKIAALEKENAELKARLGDISTTSFYALKDAYTALKSWKAGVVERATKIRGQRGEICHALSSLLVDDLAAEEEKK